MPECKCCWWYKPTIWQGEEYACQFFIPEPESCAIYSPLPPVGLCRGCEHSRWDYPDKPFCRKNKPATEDGHCPGFEARRPAAALPCPTCGAPLGVVDGAAVCSQGHRWRLRRSRSICPRCGRPYATFGIDDPQWGGLYREVYSLCPNCGWSRKERRYTGPATGRGYRGQGWSPATGRLLTR